MATLAHLFGPGVEKLKMETKTFLTPSNRKIDMNIVSSNYHLELTPRYYYIYKSSDVGMYDRIVIQELIKEIAQTQQVDANAKKTFKGIIKSKYFSRGV